MNLLKLLPTIKYNCLVPVHLAGVFCDTFVICSDVPLNMKIRDTFDVHEVNTSSGKVFADRIVTYTVVEFIFGGVLLSYPQTEKRLKLMFLPHDPENPEKTIEHSDIVWNWARHERYLAIRNTTTEMNNTTFRYN